MVAEVRGGASMRAVAQRYDVSLSTVQWWCHRAGTAPLDRVEWSDWAPIAHTVYRTAAAVEERVLALRRELRETSDLGEYGARAIHRELVARGPGRGPSVRTIGRILERRGVLDAGRRIRRLPPPPGWYLPEVATRRAELDSFDIIEGLVLRGGPRLEVLTALSLHGGLPGAWPQPLVTAKTVVEALVEHWRAFGRPAYAQFDNDTVFHGFQGGPRAQDILGRVVRTCLALDVVPVFAPPHESGFQAAIENFNGRWQAKVWTRFHHVSLLALQDRSLRYVQAYRHRGTARLDDAPRRRPFPAAWQPALHVRPSGVVIFLRRTSETGTVRLLGRPFEADPLWPHRLVRCELDLHTDTGASMHCAGANPRTNPSCGRCPMSFPAQAFTSDREAMALPFESCFL